MSAFTDLIGPALLIGAFAVIALTWTVWNKVRALASRETLNKCDFVVFETEPSQLALLQADFRRIGWTLTHTSPSDGVANLYRFERASGNAAKWGDISLDYDKYMPMTSSRKSLTLIKIKDHGLKP